MAAAQQVQALMVEEGQGVTEAPASRSQRARKFAAGGSGRVGAIAVVACVLLATVAFAGAVGIRGDGGRGGGASGDTRNSSAPIGGIEMMNVKLDSTRLPLCARNFSGRLCLNESEGTVGTRGTANVTLAPLTVISRGPMATVNNGAFSLVDGAEAVAILTPGIYQVIAQVTVQLRRPLTTTIECSVRLNRFDAILGRSLSASRSLICVAFGVLALSPGDRLRMKLSNLEAAAGRSDNSGFRIHMVDMQVIRLGF